MHQQPTLEHGRLSTRRRRRSRRRIAGLAFTSVATLGPCGHTAAAVCGTRVPKPILDFGEFPIIGALQKDGEFVGGVHVGYNWQFAPTWVAGIEGDWSWTDAKASFTQAWINIVVGVRPGSLASLSLKEDWLSTVRARIGYLVTPAALVYFTGGAAWGEFDYAASATTKL